MAYDQNSSHLVLFGGANTSDNPFFGDTWSWDGTTWTELAPATSPSPRFGASMAFDTKTRQLLLFGGSSSNTRYADTWSWDGTTWTKLAPATSPPARAYASMAWDPVSGNLLLFGGGDAGNTFGDTWSWDGTTWTKLAPAASPAAREGSSMAIDPNDQILLFGGATDFSTFYGDTWSWDGKTWHELAPATSPSPRTGAAMATTPDNGLVLFGGLYAPGSVTEYGDTWSWDGSTWTQLSSPTNPPARDTAAMAYDTASQQFVLFGGEDGPVLGDSWVFSHHISPPTISISTAATAAGTGWYNQASSETGGLTIQVSASDPAGVTQLSCTDGTTAVLSTTSGSGSFVLPDGRHAISCTATDGVGNSGVGPGSTSMPVTYNVDQTPPSVTCQAASFVYGQSGASVAATVTDLTSGPQGGCSSCRCSTASARTSS